MAKRRRRKKSGKTTNPTPVDLEQPLDEKSKKFVILLGVIGVVLLLVFVALEFVT